MRDTELYFAQKYCWAHKIFIVVKVVVDGKKYRLAISRNGKEKVGEQLYSNSKVLKHQSALLPNGKKQVHTLEIPSVHEKIAELYIDIYRKNCRDKPFQPQIQQTPQFEDKIVIEKIPGYPGFMSIKSQTI